MNILNALDISLSLLYVSFSPLSTDISHTVNSFNPSGLFPPILHRGEHGKVWVWSCSFRTRKRALIPCFCLVFFFFFWLRRSQFIAARFEISVFTGGPAIIRRGKRKYREPLNLQSPQQAKNNIINSLGDFEKFEGGKGEKVICTGFLVF